MIRKFTASVIFFHGSGDTGPSIRGWVRDLLGRDFGGSHIKYIYPTAPRQSYTPFGGEVTTVWFNRSSIDFDAAEDQGSLSEAGDIVRQLIKQETDQGVSVNRIIVGGYSNGGALALHTGYHLNTDVAGVFVHSAFLNKSSIVYDSLASKSSLPELYMFHGTDDHVVELDWGRETFDKLRKLGVQGSFRSLNGAEHELTKSSMQDVEQWILKKLP